MQFTKLFSCILDSTIWQEPPETKILWITMLAMSDRNGEVHASIPGLARRAGITLDQCQAGISCLLSPDAFSRTKDHDGRRIGVIDGGWALLNHAKYRALLSAEERREYNRVKQAEHRARSRIVNDSQSPSAKSAKSAHTEAEAEADNKPPLAPKGALQLRAEKLFNRRTETPLTDAERRAFRKNKAAIEATTEEQWRALERFHSAPQDETFARKDLSTLVNNWNGEIDRAMRWHPTRKPSVRSDLPTMIISAKD